MNREGPFWQEIRAEGGLLASALGLLAGCVFAFTLGQGVGAGLVLMGAGVLLVGAAWGPVWAFCLPFLALGWGLALWEVERVNVRLFTWAEGAKPHWMVGKVAALDIPPEGVSKVSLAPFTAYGLRGLGEACREVVVRAHGRRLEGLRVGDGVAVRAVFMPPKAPAFEGDTDWRWWGFFNRCTGAKAWEVVPTALPPLLAVAPAAHVWEDALERMRARVRGAVRGVGDGVVGALLTGERTNIPAQVVEAYRVSGLTHLIAISGMQLTLVGGGVFALLRAMMAAWPWLALRANIKAMAALGGLGAAALYTLFVGASVSVVRAFVMVAFLLVAAMLGRLRSLLRAWSLALMGILMVAPHEVLNPGFGLSFAAVLGLIMWGLGQAIPHGVLGRGRAMVEATFVAGFAVLPVVALFFHQVSLVSLPANMLAIPLMTLASWLGFGVLLLAPMGWQGPLVAMMSPLVESVNAWALFLATIPHAVVWVPPLVWPVLAVGSAGVVALAVGKRWDWAWACAFALMVGCFVVERLWPHDPLVVVDRGRAAALWEGDELRILWDDGGRALRRFARLHGLRLRESGVVPFCDDAGCGYPTEHGWVVRVAPEREAGADVRGAWRVVREEVSP